MRWFPCFTTKVWSSAGFGLELLSTTFALALFVPILAVAVRRFHDVALSGWVVGLLWVGGFASEMFLDARRIIFVTTAPDGSLDTKFDPWSIAAMLSMAAAIFIEIVIALWPGKKETNKYGPNPHEVTP